MGLLPVSSVQVVPCWRLEITRYELLLTPCMSGRLARLLRCTDLVSLVTFVGLTEQVVPVGRLVTLVIVTLDIGQCLWACDVLLRSFATAKFVVIRSGESMGYSARECSAAVCGVVFWSEGGYWSLSLVVSVDSVVCADDCSESSVWEEFAEYGCVCGSGAGYVVGYVGV